MIRAAVVALDPLGEGELAGRSCRQDGADLAVGIAGQRAVDGVARLRIVTGSSVEVFLTTKVKSTLPPVSGTAVGFGGLGDLDVGATSVKSTVASSSSVASVPSLSSATAVKTLTWSGPLKSPSTHSVKENSQVAPAARTVPTSQSASPASVP